MPLGLIVLGTRVCFFRYKWSEHEGEHLPLLLKHRMDGAVTLYLLYAFQAYHLGTGATFIRIYRSECLLVNDPHSFLYCDHNTGVGLNPVRAFGGLKGFQFVHVLGTEIRNYCIGINSVLMM